MVDKDKMQDVTRKLREVQELAGKLDDVQGLDRKLDEVIGMVKKLNEAQELAKKLNAWAEEKLPEEQQNLLKCLLYRGAYRGERIGKHNVEDMTKLMDTSDIGQAAMDAIESLIGAKSPAPIEGWPRFHPPSWPRDGYWVLGFGPPPKHNKIFPKDLIQPEGPIQSEDPVLPIRP